MLNYHHDILFFTLRPLFSNLFSKNARSKIHLPSLAPLSFDSKQDSTNRARFLKLFPLIEFAPGYWNEQVEEFGDDRAEECIDRLGRVRRSLKIHDISGEGRGRNGFGGSKRTSWKVGLKKKGFEGGGPRILASNDKNSNAIRSDRIKIKISKRRWENRRIFGRIDSRGATILPRRNGTISLLMQSVNWRQCRGRLLSHKVSSGRSAQLRVRAIIGEFIVGSVSSLTDLLHSPGTTN